MKHAIRRLPWTRRSVLAMGSTGVGAVCAGWTLPAAARAEDGAIEQPERPDPTALVARAFEMRDRALAEGDQPYGAIIVNQKGLIVGQAPSRVVTNGDPTAHAEMEAIRDAARRLGTRDLDGHAIYSSSHPCPMCEAAAYWAGLERMVYGQSGADGGPPRLCG